MVATLLLMVLASLSAIADGRPVFLIWGVDESLAVNASLPAGVINGGGTSASGAQNGGPATHPNAVNIYGNNGAMPTLEGCWCCCEPNCRPCCCSDCKVCGKVSNGAIPQLGNLSLHVATLRAKLALLIPQPAYSGLCLLDFEELRADWNSSSPALQDASLKFAKGDAMLAKTSYEAAAKKFFLATIRTVRELRPGCKLGWYGYPRNPLPHLLTPGWTAYCKSHAGVCWPFVAPGGGSGIGYDGPGAAAQRGFNDALSWLFEALDFVTPSVYLGVDSTVSKSDANATAEHVRSTVAEAVRIGKKAGKPVISVVWMQYDSYSDTAINRTAPRNLLTPADLHLELALPLELGADGVLFWGHLDNSLTQNGIAANEKYAKGALSAEVKGICAKFKCLSSFPSKPVRAPAFEQFDVMSFGAIGDGVHDDGHSIAKAVAACAAAGGGELLFQSGRIFMTGPVVFNCSNAVVTIEAGASLVAPNTTAGWPLGLKCPEPSQGLTSRQAAPFVLVHGSNITLKGGGTLDAKGQLFWAEHCGNWWCPPLPGVSPKKPYAFRPFMLRIDRSTNVKVLNLKLINSPFWTIVPTHSDGIEVGHVVIDNTKHSPNTDGVEPMWSTNVHLHDLDITNGDDCITIKSGSSNILAERLRCDGSHGLTIGSVWYDDITNVTYKDAVMVNCGNGARIKGRRQGNATISGITWHNISLGHGIKNGLVIQMDYETPGSTHNNSGCIAKDILFEGVRSPTGVKLGNAGQLECLPTRKCTDVRLVDVDLQAATGCTLKDVSGSSAADVVPASCQTKPALKHDDDQSLKYARFGDTDVPFSTYSTVAPSTAQAACDADVKCKAYNSKGALKRCAGCEGGSDCCVYPRGAQDFPAANGIELFVKQGSSAPQEWQAGIDAGSLLYSQPEPDICMMPEVGNGFVASIIDFSSMHVSGLFDGGCGGVSKAHLPSVIGISATNANASLTQAALDMKRAVYVRRLHFPGGQQVEQRIYAHRVRKHVMVVEVELLPDGKPGGVTLNLQSLFDPLCGPPPPSPPPPPALAFNGTYLKVFGDCGTNGHDVGSLPQCIKGQCKVEELIAYCNKLGAKCDVIQTHGFAKKCSDGQGPTTETKACNKRTPGCEKQPKLPLGVDSYYKIRKPVMEEERSGTSAAFGAGAACGTAGNGCAGTFTHNVFFELATNRTALPDGVSAFCGNTSRANETGSKDTVCIVTTDVPPTLALTTDKIVRFISAITTTANHHPFYDPLVNAVAEFSSAASEANASALLASHEAAWHALNGGDVGVEVLGVAEDKTGRALDLQSHIHSSFYFLQSSIRADWPHGALNPGGLASDNCKILPLPCVFTTFVANRVPFLVV